MPARKPMPNPTGPPAFTNDPAERFLEEQRRQDEADIVRQLHRDALRRLRELKSQVPDGRHVIPGAFDEEPTYHVPGELYPGGDPDYLGFRLV